MMACLRFVRSPHGGAKIMGLPAGEPAVQCYVDGWENLMMTYIWIAVGGALGSVARHWCTLVATAWLGAAFPWGTLFINIVGSFVIGLFFALTGPDGRFDVPLDAKLFVMTGICGGYTTFSAFSLQTLSLFQDGMWLRGGAYIVASVVLCLIAVWAGYALAMAINAPAN